MPRTTTHDRLSKRLGAILTSKGLTLAVAESCTGGLLGGAITETAGSSRYFSGGIIAYSNQIKQGVLGVPAGTLRRRGAVSGETVAAMARGARKLFGADCAISVSGIAGPGGGTEDKPVGLVYIGIALGKTAFPVKRLFRGTRKEIREKTVKEALQLCIALVRGTSVR